MSAGKRMESVVGECKLVVSAGAIARVRSCPAKDEFHRIGDCRSIERRLADLVGDLPRSHVIRYKGVESEAAEERNRQIGFSPDPACHDRSAIVISLASQDSVPSGLVALHGKNWGATHQAELQPIGPLPVERLCEKRPRFRAKLREIVFVLREDA